MVVMTSKDASLEEMNKIIEHHRCGECGGFLVVDNPTGECLELHCSHHPEHITLNKPVKNRDEINWQKRKRGDTPMEDTVALQKYTPERMLARVNKAKFPKDLTVEERKLIARLAIDYGLDPLFGEIMVFQGKPYVTIDARRRKAQETGAYDGLKTRPATVAERQAWKIPEDDYFFHAEVFVKDSTHSFEGWGRVRAVETKPGSKAAEEALFKPIQNNPQQMAEKRAEAQALRKAFHLPLPSAEDISTDGVVVEDDYEINSHLDKPRGSGDSPRANTPVAAKPARTQLTNKDDNEVGESAKRSAPTTAGRGGGGKQPAAPSGADETTEFSTENNTEITEKKREAPAAKFPRDPSLIKNFGDLYNACRQDWPRSFPDRRSVWKELGVSCQEDISDTPANCYCSIAEVRIHNI